MALITIPFTFSSGAVIVASQHNSCNSIIYSDYNGNIDNNNISNSAAISYSKLNLLNSIVNADINSAAAIADSKLAAISTAGKVSGAALTSLSSTPSGAGIIPIANLASGTPTGIKFIRDDGALAVPQSLSNVIYNWTGVVNSDANANFYTGNSATGGSATKGYSYIFCAAASSSYVEQLGSKWIKIAGIGTLTIYANVKQANSNTGLIKVDVGGQNGNTTFTETSFTWKTFTIDVSSLSDGTVYDLSVQLSKSDANSQFVYLGGIIIFGS